jgi:RimJ/RimL family protein N-acetyltransferase
MRVQPIDDGFLGRADRGEIKVPAHTIGWTENNWATRQNYLAHGFGFCVVDDAADEVVSWSVADCASGDRCEIGIHTLPAYQRRGLGSITSAAAVAHALGHGFKEVGWHCDEHNPGSIGTAEKVGFVLERRYTAYVYKADPGDHHTLRAYRALLDGSPQASLTEFQKAFALRNDYPFWIYFHSARAYAALDQSEAAFDALMRAADLGEHRTAMLLETKEFAGLHNQPRWQAVLATVEANSRSKAED